MPDVPGVIVTQVLEKRELYRARTSDTYHSAGCYWTYQGGNDDLLRDYFRQGANRKTRFSSDPIYRVTSDTFNLLYKRSLRLIADGAYEMKESV